MNEEQQTQQMAAAFRNFLEGIRDLEDIYGEVKVLQALKKFSPFSDMDDADLADPARDTSIENEMQLNESLAKAFGDVGKALWRTGGSAVKKAWTKIKNWVKSADDVADDAAKGAGKTGPGAVGTGVTAGTTVAALDAAGDAAGDLLGISDGENITIADISTNKPLTVQSREIEQLLITTNDAINKLLKVMTQTNQDLGGHLQKLDTSVDDMISASTGESPLQVANRQSQSTKATKKPNLSVVPKSDEKDDKKKDRPAYEERPGDKK